MDLSLLVETLAERGEPGYRVRQVWDWTARGAHGYERMTNLPAGLREELGEIVPFSTLEVETESVSRDGPLPHARRPSRRGGAHALPRREALRLPLEPVGLPAHVHVLRDRPDAFRPQPDRIGDP
jgi:hypothetical protein